MQRPTSSSTPFSTFRSFLALATCGLAAAVVLPACSHKVSGAECAALLDRFVQMKVAEDPATKNLTGGALDSARISKVQAMQSDSDVKQVEKACETEVSRAEYDCAIKATSTNAWNDCIQ